MGKKNLHWLFIFILIGALLIVAEYLTGEAEESKSFSIRITGDLLEGEKTSVDPSIQPVFTPDGKYVIVNSGSKNQFVITTEGKIVNKTPQALQKEYPPSEKSKEGIFPYLQGCALWIYIKDKGTTKNIKIIDDLGGGLPPAPEDASLAEKIGRRVICYKSLLSPKRDRLLIQCRDAELDLKHCVYDLKTNCLYDLPKVKQPEPKPGPGLYRYVPFHTYTWAPNGQWLLYCKTGTTGPGVKVNADLFITSWDGKQTIQLTNDGKKILEQTTAWSYNKIAFTYSVIKPKKPRDKGYDPDFGPTHWRNTTRIDGIRIAEIIFEKRK